MKEKAALLNSKETSPVKHRSEFRRALRRFAENKMAALGAMTILAIALVCVLAPLIANYVLHCCPEDMDFGHEREEPSLQHPLGTDRMGRDVLLRLLYGGRVSLVIGLAIVAISMTMGTLFGAMAGYFGGLIDELLMRFVDILRAIPSLYLILFVVTLVSPNVTTTILILGFTSWMGPARIVRSEILSIREREYVTAARSIGASRTRIVLRHILPHVVPTIAVAATLGIARGIVAEAGLSFLGLGVQPPDPSLGNMIGEAQGLIWVMPRLLICPALVLSMTILSLNFVGDGLRDALDPRLTR
jgi:peptide/nickel transport system permease protein